MKKLLSVLLCVVFALSLLSSSVCAAGGNLKLSATGKVTDPKSGAGTLTVTVSVKENTGINCALVKIGYNANTLKLTSVTNGVVFTEENNGSMFEVNESENPLKILFEEKSVNNISATGKLVTLKFEIINDMGNFDITFDVDEQNTFAANGSTPESINITASNDVSVNTQHVYGGLPVTIQPTCTESGRIEKRCNTCNKVLNTVETGEPLGHDWQEVERTEPTCTKEGEVKSICSLCEEEKTETLPIKDHSLETVKVEPTAEKEGSETVKCKYCGKVVSTKTIAKLKAENKKAEDETPKSPKTGDEIIVLASVALVATLGSALLLIKRRKDI